MRTSSLAGRITPDAPSGAALPRPSSPAAYGAGQRGPAPDGAGVAGPTNGGNVGGGAPTFVDRTVRIPLEALPDPTWITLRRIAYQCAAFGNHLLSASYLRAKGGPKLPAYRDANGVLASAVRDAVNRECVGLWRRLGRRILRGEQTLARFSADRALVVRERGVHLATDADGAYIVQLRVQPKRVGDVACLPVWQPGLRKNPYLSNIVEALWTGRWTVTKATVQFERPGRKVYVRLHYRKPTAATREEGPTATLAWTVGVEGAERPGELWLRCEGRALSLNDTVTRLSRMKTHFAGIHARLRRDLGKRGRRRVHRLALLKAGSFEQWAGGPLHQVAHEIVRWALEQRAGALTMHLPNDGALPWHRLALLVVAKAEEQGLIASQIEGPSAQEEQSRTDGK